MEQIIITEEKMLQLVQLYNNAVYDHGKATKELAAVNIQIAANEEPLAPSIDEFNTYQKQAKRFTAIRSDQQKIVDNSVIVMKNARIEIIKNLPDNKWIKVGKYYVGHRTDDWPSSDGDLFIQTEKPTKELSHQIVN